MKRVIYFCTAVLDTARYIFLSTLVLFAVNQTDGIVHAFLMPNLIFIVLTILLGINSEKYQNFCPLYILGKAMCLLAQINFLITTMTTLIPKSLDHGGTMLIAFWDILSIPIIFFITKKQKKTITETADIKCNEPEQVEIE